MRVSSKPLITDSREQQSVRLWLELLRCAKTQEAKLAARLRKSFGQSLTRFDALSQLYRAPDTTLLVTELATRMLASKSKNITRLVDRMEEDGLVSRRPNPGDRRSFVVSLTRKGWSLFEEMAIEHGHWVCKGFEGLAAAELSALQSSMVKLREHLEQDD